MKNALITGLLTLMSAPAWSGGYDDLALEALPGVSRLPVRAKTRCVTLRFAEEEVVFSREGGLLHCPSSRDLLDLDGDRPQYEMLPLTLARDIVETLTLQEARTSELCPMI